MAVLDLDPEIQLVNYHKLTAIPSTFSDLPYLLQIMRQLHISIGNLAMVHLVFLVQFILMGWGGFTHRDELRFSLKFSLAPRNDFYEYYCYLKVDSAPHGPFCREY